MRKVTRKPIYVTKEILLKDVHSPPTRQPRKDYTTKTPTTVEQQVVLKQPRG